MPAANKAAAAPSTVPPPPPAISCRAPWARPPPGRHSSISRTPKGRMAAFFDALPSKWAMRSRSSSITRGFWMRDIVHGPPSTRVEQDVISFETCYCSSFVLSRPGSQAGVTRPPSGPSELRGPERFWNHGRSRFAGKCLTRYIFYWSHDATCLSHCGCEQVGGHTSRSGSHESRSSLARPFQGFRRRLSLATDGSWKPRPNSPPRAEALSDARFNSRMLSPDQ